MSKKWKIVDKKQEIKKKRKEIEVIKKKVGKGEELTQEEINRLVIEMAGKLGLL